MENEIDVAQWHPVGHEFVPSRGWQLIEAVSLNALTVEELAGRYNYLIMEFRKQQQADQEVKP